MLDWIKKYWPALILSAALLAMLDGMFSSLMTCHPVSQQPAGGTNPEEAKEYCTALNGPILSVIRWGAYVTRKYDTAITAVFTIVLAIFTGRLWVSTEKLWRETKVAAEAAKQSADALPTIERAYIFIVPTLEFLDISPGTRAFARRISVTYSLENHGKTPAAVDSIFARLQILAEPPDNSVHLISNLIPGEKIVRSDGSWQPDSSPVSCNVSQSESEDIEENRAAIWFYGSILYKDVFGNERITRFRWCYSAILEIFTPRGEPPYNERK